MFKGVFCIGLIWIWRVLCYTYHLLPQAKKTIYIYIYIIHILDSSTQFYTEPDPTLSWKRVCGHPKNCPTIIRSATKTRSDKLPCAMATAVFEGLVFFRETKKKEIGVDRCFFQEMYKRLIMFFEIDVKQLISLRNFSDMKAIKKASHEVSVHFTATMCWSPWTKKTCALTFMISWSTCMAKSTWPHPRNSRPYQGL